MWKARPGTNGALIGGSSLETVSKFFRTSLEKPKPTWEDWQLAALGDKDALAKLVERCEADAQITRLVFQHLKPLIRMVHR
jgi:hypothetical protein